MSYSLFEMFICGFTFFSLGILVALLKAHQIYGASARKAYLFVAAQQAGASEAELLRILK